MFVFLLRLETHSTRALQLQLFWLLHLASWAFFGPGYLCVQWLLAVALLGCYGLRVCLGFSGFWANGDELERP